MLKIRPQNMLIVMMNANSYWSCCYSNCSESSLYNENKITMFYISEIVMIERLNFERGFLNYAPIPTSSYRTRV